MADADRPRDSKVLLLSTLVVVTQVAAVPAAALGTCGETTPGEAAGIGTPMLRVTSHDAVAANASLTYGAACSATGHMLVYGPLQDVAAYGYSGQLCDVGEPSTFDWNYPQESVFFLVVGNDGTVDGSYGVDADGLERPPYLAGNQCSRSQDLATRCDASVRQTIGPDGGVMSVQNCGGDLLTLEFPAGALDQPVAIRMTALEEPADSPFAHKVIPGVVIEPHQLRLAIPATLRWQPGGGPLPSGTLMFWVVDEDLAFALGGQSVSSNELVGTVSHFSTFDAAEPTLEEIEGQLSVEPTSLNLPGDPYGLLETQTVVDGFLTVAALADTLGNSEVADMFWEKAREYLANAVNEFLTIGPPAGPCGEYYFALAGYEAMARALLPGDSLAVASLGAQRLAIDAVWCCFSLSGSWSAVEVADETGCDEGINTYTSSATIVDSGYTLTISGFNGSAVATRNRCFITAFGSESEDSGVTYGNGSGTIDPTGDRFMLSGSWTWVGDDESCSGTSDITFTRR